MERVKISEDLLKIKDLVGKPGRMFNKEKRIATELKQLGHKVEEIEKRIRERGFDLRRVNEIIFLLQDRELNSSDVGKILRISRNRASEYLKKMELDKILKSRFKGKKKFFSVINHD